MSGRIPTVGALYICLPFVQWGRREETSKCGFRGSAIRPHLCLAVKDGEKGGLKVSLMETKRGEGMKDKVKRLSASVLFVFHFLPLRFVSFKVSLINLTHYFVTLNRSLEWWHRPCGIEVCYWEGCKQHRLWVWLIICFVQCQFVGKSYNIKCF